jgi:hypothetical protein
MPERESRSLSRHPFQVWALFAFVVGGVGVLLGPPPNSVDALVHPWLRASWAVVLVSGGLAGLISETLRDRVLGLLIERAALVAVCGGALAYGVAVLWAARAGGLLAGLLVLSVGLASGTRAWDVTQTLRRLAAMHPPDPS